MFVECPFKHLHWEQSAHLHGSDTQPGRSVHVRLEIIEENHIAVCHAAACLDFGEVVLLSVARADLDERCVKQAEDAQGGQQLAASFMITVERSNAQAAFCPFERLHDLKRVGVHSYGLSMSILDLTLGDEAIRGLGRSSIM